MITVTALFTLAMVPIVIATAAFGLAVEGTENAMKKAGQAIYKKFHKQPVSNPVK